MSKPAFDPEAFVQDMLNDAHAQAFFKKYDVEPERIEEFLARYAKHKGNVLEKGDSFTRYKQKLDEEHKEMAWKAYGAILNRKIFILQCRWRAEQVVINDIAIAYDFWYWGRDPYNCPFIDEVTAEELELMKTFLLRPEFRRWDLEYHDHWQDYDKFLKKPAKDARPWDRYPDWYTFCDTHGLHPDCRSLPNIRGKKEHRYLEAGMEASRKRMKAKSRKKEIKKYLDYGNRDLMAYQLAAELGDTSTAQYLGDRRHVYKGQLYPDVEDISMYFEIFHNQKFPVRANKNWGEGLNMAADQFFARQAATVLMDTHEEYLYRKVNDLLEKEDLDYMRIIADRYREYILEGRKLNGEPEDLKF